MELKNRQKNAFTLAEVLITLAIIGVVASLTIPAVVKNYRAKQYEVGLKKAQSVLNNVANLMRLETGMDLTKANYQTGTFKAVFAKYFSIIEDCGLQGCFNKATPVYRNFSNTTDAGSGVFNDGNFVLKDGMLVMIDNDTYDLQVSVDTNGYKKAPNRWGYDLFTFYLTDGGKFVPVGASNTVRTDKNTYCSKTGSTHHYNGIACTYYALTDPNYFKELE